MPNEDKQIPFWELLNLYRAFPRLFSLMYVVLTGVVSYWFMGLITPSMEQAAFVSTMVATGAAFFKFYVESGPGKPKQN